MNHSLWLGVDLTMLFVMRNLRLVTWCRADLSICCLSPSIWLVFLEVSLSIMWPVEAVTTVNSSGHID